MSRRVWVVALGISLSSVVGPAVVRPASVEATRERLRVLLVGNSYTRFNVMPTLVQRIADSVQEGPRMRVDSVAHAGYTLRMHWKRREARQRIRRRRYTHVVLQGHSLEPLERRDEFTRYAQQLARLVVASRARPVLYETWARHVDAPFYREHPDVESAHAMQRVVGDAYARLAGDLDAVVAPVGQAFAQSDVEAPELELHRGDGSHPTVLGSYLAALVLYGTVSGVNPEHTDYRPFPVTRSQAIKARVLASEVLARRLPPEPLGVAVADDAQAPESESGAPPIDAEVVADMPAAIAAAGSN